VGVFYRDVGIVIGHFMRLLFWISPILWSFTAVAGRGASLQDAFDAFDRGLGLPTGTLFGVLRLNPISLLLESYRQVIYGNLHVTEQATGRPELTWSAATPPDVAVLAVILASGLVILVVGTILFKRLEPAFAKVL
jgi:ABC-type polysaccharide/polyol phosphate export permease